MRQSCVNFLSFLYEYEFEICDLAFLVADTQLYKRLCPSVRPSVGPSVIVIELKTSVFDTFCVCLSVGPGLGCGWGLDAPAHPSATIL